jgi:hypothetical protein
VGEETETEWEPFAQGKEKAKAWLDMHPLAADAIDARVRSLIKQERAAGLAKGTVGASVARLGAASAAAAAGGAGAEDAEDVTGAAGGPEEEDTF